MSKLIMLTGLPASGKSTIAEAYREDGFIVHSSDELRREMLGNVGDQSKNTDIFAELHRRIVADLKEEKNVVYDATNLSYKRRKAFLESINKIDCTKVAVVMATPYDDCIDRDSKREKKVGQEVIERMYKSFTMPSKMEGFDEINIVYNREEYEEFNIWRTLQFLSTVKQHNSNHSLTIGNHCEEVVRALDTDNWELRSAGLLHDFGKVKVMSFKDSKGKFSEQCHFYNHENVSAYDAMFYMKDSNHEIDTVTTCNLIQYHMRLHVLKTEKSINKFKKFVGEEFFEMLVMLNEADKEGRQS